MSIRNYFRPSNGLSKPTGSIIVALKGENTELQVRLLPGQLNIFMRPVTVHSIVPSHRKNSEHTSDTFFFFFFL